VRVPRTTLFARSTLAPALAVRALTGGGEEAAGDEAATVAAAAIAVAADAAAGATDVARLAEEGVASVATMAPSEAVGAPARRTRAFLPSAGTPGFSWPCLSARGGDPLTPRADIGARP